MFNITHIKEGETFVFYLRGALDIESTANFKNVILSEISEARNPQIRLELTDLTHLDSSGLGALYFIKNSIDKAEGFLVLSGLSPSLKTLFEASGFLKLFRFQ